MKIYELMNILKNLPAGMTVRAMDNANARAGVGTLYGTEVDGDDADGIITLNFYGEKN